MRTRNIILCALYLLAAGIGPMSASAPPKAKADRYGVRESAPVELLSKKKQDGNKITFRCRITRYNDNYLLLAKILKNDSAMHVVRPGVKFFLSDGDSVTLKAERPAACCSSWADGRWYNTSFKLDTADVEKLTEADILSVTIPFYGGVVSRKTVPGRERSFREQLQSIRED